jgi:hypothetical protein
MSQRIISTLLIGLFSYSLFAQQTIPLNNPDFDFDLLLEGGWDTTATGWQVTGNAGFFNPTASQYPSEGGERGNVGFTNAGSLIQVTGELLALDTEYTLNLEVGHRADTAQAPFTVRFVADGLVLAQTGGYTIAPGDWRPVTLKLVTDAAQPIGSPLEIHLVSTGNQTNYDNITLVSDTPSGGGTGNNDALITEDLTIHVPSEYPGIQEALDSLDNKLIAGNATVTIQVADGVYPNLAQIDMDHGDGKNIHLIGNTSDANQCVLQFPGNGLLIDDGRGLGLLNGFRIETGARGISVVNGSFLTTGEQLEIIGGSHGLLVHGGSTVRAVSIKIRNSSTGINVSEGAYVFLGLDWVIENCTNTGIYAQNNATVGASGGILSNNNIAIYANIQAVVFMGGTVLSGNNTNYSAAHYGSISHNTNGSILTIP